MSKSWLKKRTQDRTRETMTAKIKALEEMYNPKPKVDKETKPNEGSR